LSDLPDAPHVAWNSVQNLFLTDNAADVLLIMDCCNALSAFDIGDVKHPGTVVLWAACNPDMTTPVSGITSFTTNLIEELKSVHREGKIVEDINRSLVDQMNRIQIFKKYKTRNAPQCQQLHMTKPYRPILLKKLEPPKPAPTHKLNNTQGAVEQVDNTKDPESPDNIMMPSDATQTANAQNESVENSNKDEDVEVPTESTEVKNEGSDASETVSTTKPTIFDLNSPDEINWRTTVEPAQAQDERTNWLLQALYYPEMNMRSEQIVTVFENSFEWIFEHPFFVQWATTIDFVLWITGKPGSGKSTLMNMVIQHDKLPILLSAWTQENIVNIATHFFWAAGTLNQKSFRGFLMNLLFQVVKKYPQAGDFVFSDLDERYPDFKSCSADDFARMIMKALHDFRSPIWNTYWCFLIDGLDECEMTHEVIRFLKALCQRPTVKICVSSRPKQIFKLSFENYPLIRLEDLTYQDIEMFVYQKLVGYSYIWGYNSEVTKEFEILATEVTRKAEGVFLWVVLAVRSLLRGFQNCDSFAQLKHRLDILPSDLQNLFHQMLLQVQDHNWKESSIFQVAFACEAGVVDLNNGSSIQPCLTTTTLYFALHNDTNDAMTARIKPIADKDVQEMANRVSFDLDKVTNGLIVPDIRDSKGLAWREEGFTISYIHKTARDYLVDTGFLNRFNDDPKDTTDNPYLALLRASVMQLKVLNFGTTTDMTMSEITRLRCWSIIEQAVKYAHKISGAIFDDAIQLLDELDRVMTYQMTKWSDGSLFQHWSSLLPLGRDDKDQGHNFLSFMVSCGLHQYLTQKLRDGFCTIRKPKRPLLDYAINPQPQYIGHPGISKTVEQLLQEGANPNEQYDGQTMWGRFLQTYRLYDAQNATVGYKLEISKVHELLIAYGAN
jgi:NACHT domain